MENMDNMNNFDNMNDVDNVNSSDNTYGIEEEGGMGFNSLEKTDSYPDTAQVKNGHINIQSVPVKKSKFKKFAPFAAVSLISAMVGVIAGGAYVNYLVGKNSYTTPITSSTNQNPIKTAVNYQPPNSLIARIAEDVGPAIVGISTKTSAQGFFSGKQVQQGSTGSGIIFDKSGYVVTNQHVIDGSSEIVVKLAGGKMSFKAQVVGADPRSDLAILKLADVGNANLPAAVFGDSDKVRVGDLAIAIGNPLGEEYAGSVTSGIISALNRKMNIDDGEYNRRYKLIQTDAAINPGNSGGALINENGEVIGINTIKYIDSKVEGMGFAIPINDAKPIIDELMKNGYISRPQLGVTVVTITEQMAKDYNCPVGAGVEEVRKGGSAEAAGIKPRDVVTEVNGVKIISNESLISELEKYKPGESVKVKVWRDGKDIEIPVTLGEQRKQAS